MKIALGLLLASVANAQSWEVLFDGVSTQGWLEVTGAPFPASWKIQDGCLKTVPNPQNMQDLRTMASFRTFEFRFEWKLAPGGNSGVKYRIEKTDRWQRPGESGYQARARGPEYQLLDDPKAPANQQSGALYTVHAPALKKLPAADIFHESRIIVLNDRVEHWLDGERVLAYPLSAPPKESFLSLQNHNSVVWFRNLRIRRLDAEAKAIAYLQVEVPRWRKENGCYSCHNDGDGGRALALASQRGWAEAPGPVTNWENDRANPAFSDKKLARIHFATGAALVADQQPDGSWKIDGEEALGSPVTYGRALATYMSLQKIRAGGIADAAAKANAWLRNLKPISVVDAAAKSMLTGTPEPILLAAQNPDGGWGPYPGRPSEAFDTAVALLALHRHHPSAVARGRAYLARTQQPAGGWPETTRPPGSLSYAQHISTSAWATIALLTTLDDPER